MKPKGQIHLAGVGGVGMSALAQALLAAGWRVTGSDRHIDQGTSMPVLDALCAAGVECMPQDGGALSRTTAALVVSTAIEEENPEIQAARRLEVPIRHRAEVLYDLSKDHAIYAVAGTAGKTTTTGMLGWALEQLGADPTVVNGGALVDWATPHSVGNFRRGAATAPWVLELDESDNSINRFPFAPDWSILTNISEDHYPLATIQDMFRTYASRVKTGWVMGPGVQSVIPSTEKECLSESVEMTTHADGVSFVWKKTDFFIPQLGEHNGWNAFLTVLLCERLGYPLRDIADALEKFRGIQRRLEEIGRMGTIRVVDDYAHNPAKITAAWQALSQRENRILGMWRPHGYGPLRMMFNEFAEAFAIVCRPQDHLWILPVYYAGGSTNRTIESDSLVARLKARGIHADFAPDYDTLCTDMLAHVQPQDVLLCMGARDPAIPEFARRLYGRLS